MASFVQGSQTIASQPVTNTWTVPAPVATTTQLSGSPNPSHPGQAVTFTAVVNSATGAGTPTGMVTFTIDGQDQAPQGLSVVGGHEQATFVTSTLAVGTHQVVAHYTGDSRYAASPDSNVWTQTVLAPPAKQAAVVGLTAAPNPSTFGQAVTVMATVSPGAAGLSARQALVPTGWVTFVVDGQAQPPVALHAAGNAATAVLRLTNLSVGHHTIFAGYYGDSHFQAGHVARSTTLTVQPVPAGGPQVVGVERFGYHWFPTTLVLSFDQTLDPTRAQNAANYLLTAGRGSFSIPIVSAVYDAATRTVTLRPRYLLPLHDRFVLRVNGAASSGLTNPAGLPLQGAGAGHPGTSFVTTIDRSDLVKTPGGAPLASSRTVPLGPAALLRSRQR